MKKQIGFLLLFLVFVLLAKAQPNFYGVTPGNATGVISKYNPLTNSLTAVYTFQNSGYDPYGSEFVEVSGKLYGTTAHGGTFNKGVLFSFDPLSNSYTKLYDLTASCTGVLTNGQGSMIYGLTSDYIFSFNISTSSFTTRYNFTPEQKWPVDGLTIGSNGKLYGITASRIFSYDTTTNTYTKLLDLDPSQGGPECGLTLGADNNFYFNTIGGDVNYSGNIYRFNPVNLSLQNVHNYNGVDGEFPFERMTLAGNGKLYGSTSASIAAGSFGVLFSYDPATGIYQKIHDFVSGAGGRLTQPLAIGSDGKLYGGSATLNYDNGILFSLDPATNNFAVLHNFENSSSFSTQEGPTGKLVRASNGRFYGMLANEWQSSGKIYSYDPTTTYFSTNFNFSQTNGINPNSSLVAASNGLLYGTTTSGGLHDLGVLFSFDPATNTYTKRYDFDESNGYFTSNVLTALGNRKIYGTTSQGSASGLGVIFSFDPATNTYTKIYDFTFADGSGGIGLTEANNGLLYSVSKNASEINIYSVNPITNVHTNYTNLTNVSPVGKFVKTPNGKLYALGLGGDYAYGVIFSFDPQTNTGIRAYSIDGTKGRYPFGDLFFASDGGLYGMTSEGGANNSGVLFYYDPLPNILDKLFDFDGTNGTKPMGSLIQGDDGKLYGMTSTGGTNNLGVVFSYRPSTGIYAKLQDFNGINGGNSQFGSFTKLGSSTTKVVKVNIYGGTNPYNNPEWNNWNTFASLSSGNLHYSDGSSSTIVATLSQQTSVSDNGPSYTTTIAPQEVTRYASYSTTSRTLTISGLDNNKNYTLELYATRAGASNNTTQFIIQNRVADIPTANNLTMKASYNALGAVSGVMTLNISGLNTYNYINGFTLTEIGAGETNTAPTVDAGPDKTITLPVNSVQMNGSASDPNGFITSYNWTKLSGPSQYSINNSADPATTISNLVQGTYVFRLGVYDNQGAFSFDEVTVTVNPAPSSTKHVKVNLYGGVNPYNHPEWNNWNSYSLSSGTLKYSDGTSSPISAALSQQSGIADNGTTYNATMAPVEVVRYASYSSSNRTLTISGLENSKTYNLELYASRNGATNNTTRFTIRSTSIDILTDNNLSNKASFTSIVPSGGKITVNISKLNAYNYLNGFVLTENGVSSPITRKDQINSQEQVLSTSINIYPNPAIDRIVLNINNNYTGQMKVEIIDVKGAVVKQFKLSKIYKGISQNYLPVSDLRRGEYLIRIQTGSQVEVRKLLKL